jgi:hypothetical protein
MWQHQLVDQAPCTLLLVLHQPFRSTSILIVHLERAKAVITVCGRTRICRKISSSSLAWE